MSKRTSYHVTKRPDGDWNVIKAGGQRPSSTHETQSQAIAAARVQAKQQPLGQVVIHGTDNKIRNEYTYGKDPFPPAG